ncbi:Mitochondrial uncoupling protein 1 [Picochlorum sp. SENEW3]|nr:Mitochondrial uncoupling protein 1 [Picochlorum sp. SENEW3]WPT14733.1 Mitochondrial uncoupling protein 1 [Picochlorum sp. SENEW3]
MAPSGSSSLPFPQTFASSAIAACTAEIISLPLDTAKVLLQLQKKDAAPKYKGLIGTCMTVAREEGSGALWKGLGPGLQRQVIYGGLRIGLYDPVKSFCTSIAGGDSLGVKIASGLLSGAIGITIASPTDLVKVRMQSQGKQVPKKYPSAVSAYSIIIKEEGLGALWTGLGPNIARNALINAAELASYDQIKQTLLGSGAFKDNLYCHVASSLGAGFVAVCVGSPVDVVKSRMMGAPAGMYSGMMDAFVQTAKKDGIMAFYNGFGPNFARLGTWNVVMFVTLEQVKQRVFGAKPN